MYKRDFIEKPYDVMNDIILYLYNTQNIVTKSDLAKTFSLSFNTLNEYIRLIDLFIKEQHFDQDLFLTIENDQVCLKKSPAFPIKNCIEVFLTNSIKYQIVIQLFERGEIQSEVFQAEYNISAATYYRRVTELNDLLSEFRLKIKRRKLEGEEKQIRYFFFCFYWLLTEDKSAFERETSNQYLGFINTLSQSLEINFESPEILQIKLWMKISFKRMTKSPSFIFDPAYDSFDRPLFNDINRIFVEYMIKSDRNYSVYEAYMFYDFFCSMRNFSANSVFAFRLSEAQKLENSYLNYINQTILSYLKTNNYLAPNVSEKRQSFIEHLLYQFHSQIYYFDGIMLNFDHWGIDDMSSQLRKPYTSKDVHQLMRFCQKTFSDYQDRQSFSNKLAEINYTVIFDQLAEFNQNHVIIAVHQSLNPYYRDLVIQNIENSIGLKYPIKVAPFVDSVHYDILLSNTVVENISKLKTNRFAYTYTDFCNDYDLQQVENLVHLLLDRNKNNLVQQE